jgi:hypothetical protein
VKKRNPRQRQLPLHCFLLGMRKGFPVRIPRGMAKGAVLGGEELLRVPWGPIKTAAPAPMMVMITDETGRLYEPADSGGFPAWVILAGCVDPQAPEEIEAIASSPSEPRRRLFWERSRRNTASLTLSRFGGISATGYAPAASGSSCCPTILTSGGGSWAALQ